MKKEKSIYGYIRCSTDEQAQSGLGLEAQREAIIRSIGHEPDAWFTDEGYSGKRADRPGLLAALDTLKRGDTLIVSKRDRLARETFLSCWIEKEVLKRGARIVSAAGEGTEGNDPADILMRRMVDAFAEYERLIIGQRTKVALARRKAQGKKLGGCTPFGFTADAAGVLAANPLEQEIIARVRELSAAGLSLRQISDELNAQGFVTRSGAQWRHQYISNMLQQSA